MGIFTVGNIYQHMHDEHGTLYDDDPVGEHVNVREQQRLFELAAQQVRLEEELIDWRLEHRLFEEMRGRENEAVARQAAAAVREEVARRERREAMERRVADARREQARQEEVERLMARQQAVLQDYHQRIAHQRRLEERERERAQVQEERPGWGCTVM